MTKKKRPPAAKAPRGLRKSTSCSDGGRPHPSGCTLSFSFRGPKIGAHHSRRRGTPCIAWSQLELDLMIVKWWNILHTEEKMREANRR